MSLLVYFELNLLFYSKMYYISISRYFKRLFLLRSCISIPCSQCHRNNSSSAFVMAYYFSLTANYVSTVDVHKKCCHAMHAVARRCTQVLCELFITRPTFEFVLPFQYRFKAYQKSLANARVTARQQLIIIIIIIFKFVNRHTQSYRGPRGTGGLCMKAPPTEEIYGKSTQGT